MATCVFPTPVGPRNRNEPIGLELADKPARDRRMALATALIAASWPITCAFKRSSNPNTRSRFPWFSFETGIPVYRETTIAIYPGPTKSCIKLLLFFSSSHFSA